MKFSRMVIDQLLQLAMITREPALLPPLIPYNVGEPIAITVETIKPQLFTGVEKSILPVHQSH